MVVALIIKAGMAPFHFWFPQVIININWTQAIILFTWQKIAPLMLVSSVLRTLTIYAALSSALIGALRGLNQTIIKTILTFSSISHSGWIVIACVINIKLWLIYFTVYSFLLISIVNTLWNKITKINELNFINTSIIFKICWSSIILSLGGIPPLIGFLRKILVINKLIFYLIFASLIILITSSLISLYWYLRLIYSSLSIQSSSFKIIIKNNKPYFTLIFWFASLLNFLSPAILIILT